MRKRYFEALILLSILNSHNVFTSDFGTQGLIDLPTARMSSDGILTTSLATQSQTNSYALTYQATPWFEGTFRYTGFNEFSRYDRNYEAKFRIWEEQKYLPQVAVGLRDIVGTGLWGSEYVVASKEIGNFDFSVGIGWGRLAGEGDFKNPLRIVSDSFRTRDKKSGEGGTFATNTFFSGEHVGVFGGFSYKFDSLPFNVLLEYNPDEYVFEVGRGAKKPKSPISVGVEWAINSRFSISFSRQHRQEWGLSLAAKLDTRSIPAKPSMKLFRSSLDMLPTNLPETISQGKWYDMLLFDAERSGIFLIEATINETTSAADIVMGNASFSVWADAIDTMLNLADLHLPTFVKNINLVIEESGHRVSTVRLRRPSFASNTIKIAKLNQIQIEPTKNLSFVQHKTDFVSGKFILDFNLANRLQLFDPDDPARYQVYLNMGMTRAFRNSWALSGSFGLDIKNNFDESKRESTSVLPHVRSDVIKYLQEGDSGIDSLYLHKRGTLGQVHYRVFGGILESMYSGIGGEVLYQPFRSRIALGVSGNWVKQRDYKKNFKHLNYETFTGFLSMYWATQFYNFDVALHAGRYLAGDLGATLEVRRTFDNGWMIGLWASSTNVSAEDFGEGSFDKGLFFKVPISHFFANSGRNSYTTRIRPVQRDGGQFLEDFTGKIWWDLRDARYDSISENSTRFLR